MRLSRDAVKASRKSSLTFSLGNRSIIWSQPAQKIMELKSMEILQVCPFSLAGVGGVSEHVRNISERLARRHNVTVYATMPRSRLPRHELSHGVKVERFERYAPNDAYFFSLDMLLKLRKVEFDVVHAHCYHCFPMHFSYLAKYERFVATPHFHGIGHSVFRGSLIRLLKPFGGMTLRKADKIITVSEYEKSLILEKFAVDRGKVVVIPNGIDFTEFSRLSRQTKDYRSILYVGYLASYKGPQYLIEILPKLAQDVVLEIVGKGPLKPFLEKRATELKVHNRIRFCQDLSRPELLQKYANADVFVMLSRLEAYSIVVAEALAAGTPCIVAETSALTEWVDNESCFGISLPIKSNELARLVESVLDKGVDRRVMEKWIGTKIPDWNDVAKKLETIYTL